MGIDFGKAMCHHWEQKIILILNHISLNVFVTRLIKTLMIQ